MAVGISPILDWARIHARIEYGVVREIIAEFLGTFLLLLFTTAGTCNIYAMSGNFNSATFFMTSATVIPVAFGYFIATLLFGGVSGAHINPAVSVGLAIAGRLSWIKLHAFILVQFVGGYLGSMLGYALFKSYITRSITGSPINVVNSVAFFNASPGFIPLGAGFANEIVISAIFMMSVMAIKDMWNSHSPRWSQGILTGLVVLGLGFGFGQTTGVAINPVRDLCPRLAAISYGWSSSAAFKGVLNQNWWSVGLFAPFIGAAVGSFLYIFVIGTQLKYQDDEDGELVTLEGNGNNQWKQTIFVPKIGPQGHVPHARSPSPMPQQYAQPQGRVQFK